MKVLMLFPPQWSPVSPHFAIPSLLGQLKKAGFESEAIDLNIDFYNDFLNPTYLTEVVNSLPEMQANILSEISTDYNPEKRVDDYSIKMQGLMLKYSKVKEYNQQKTELLKNIPKLATEASVILKSKEYFYNPKLSIKALNILDTALEVASLPYFPSKMSFSDYTNPFFKLNYESIKYHCFDDNTNMFMKYFREKLPTILKNNPEYIGISINSSTQIIPGLTLAYLIKQRSNGHVNIGGNFFGRVADSFEYRPEFFDLFADSVLVEEGEKPAVDLARYINNEITIEESPNLIYKDKNNNIIFNEKTKPLLLNDVANLDLTGYDFSKYYAPEIVMPFQTSKGCYWGKCSFCDHDFGQGYNIKKIEKVIDQLVELKEKYGLSKFEFIDEAISPAYFDKMTDKLLENNVDVDFFSNARIETGFSKEILTKARKAGLRMLLWGLESGSRRIMELINKGIDLDRRFEILGNSSESDIWNFAFVFFGFPAERIDEARETIEMLCKYNDIINSYGRSDFTMGKHTLLRKNPEEYGIIGITEQQDEFSPTYDFQAIGMTKEEYKKVTNECTQACSEAYKNPLWMYLRYREYLFLYIVKHGVKWVQNYKLHL